METKPESSTKLKVLCLEDSPRDLEIMRELLADAGLDLDMDCTAVENEFTSLLRKRRYDIILSDFKLPGFDAHAALRWSMEICPNVPFICVSGTVGEEIAIELLKDGAVDYILKDRLARLPSAIKRALAEAKEREARQRAEEALQISEQQFRNVFDHASVGKSITSLDGDLKVNDAFCEMLGYSKAELSKVKWVQLTHPDDLERDKKIIESVVSRKRDSARWEKRYLHKDGKVVWGDISTVLQCDNAGKPLYLISTVIDVTARKQSEEALRSSESQFRMLWGATVEGIVILNQGIIVEVNDAMCRMFGYTREQSVGKSLLHFAPPEVHDSVRRRVTSEIEGQFETEGLRADGERIVLEAFARHILYQGKPMRMVAVRDITDRKRAEEKHQNSEAFLNRLIEQSPVPMWIADNQGTLLRLNHACSELLNLKAVEVVGRYNILQDNIVKEQGFMPLVEAVFDRGDTARFEINYDTAKVEGLSLERMAAVHLEVTLFPIRDTHGRITNAVIQHNDITARKRAEEALSTSEVRYRRLFEAARDGILILDADSGTVIDVNPFLVDMLGYPRDRILGKRIWELGFFKDTAANKVYLSELQRNEFIQYEDMPLETAKGLLINVEFVSHVYQVERHKVIQCNIRDITGRKQAEEKVLRQVEELLRWQEVTLGREDRIRELKREVNELAARLKEDIRYPSQKDVAGNG